MVWKDGKLTFSRLRPPCLEASASRSLSISDLNGSPLFVIATVHYRWSSPIPLANVRFLLVIPSFWDDSQPSNREDILGRSRWLYMNSLIDRGKLCGKWKSVSSSPFEASPVFVAPAEFHAHEQCRVFGGSGPACRGRQSRFSLLGNTSHAQALVPPSARYPPCPS